jgi:hypothetical protein
MGCSIQRDKGGVMFICGSGVEPCSVCGRMAQALCDYPVGPRKTCDQPLCDKHAIKQGAEWQDIHFCPTHVLIAEGWIRRRGRR